MAHHITESDNLAFTGDRSKIWHGLGVQIPDGLSAADALELAGLDWETVLLPLFAKDSGAMTLGGFFHEDIPLPGYCAHVRKDNGAPLAVVSRGFVPVQNRELAEFCDLLCGQDAAPSVSTMGSVRGGRRVFACLQLPGMVRAKLPEDVSKSFLLVTNGHDGKHGFRAYFSSVRPVCDNTLVLSEGDAVNGAAFRHTGNMADKLEAARKILGLATKQEAQFQELVTELSHKSVTSEETGQIFSWATNEAFPPYSVKQTEAQRARIVAKRTRMLNQLLENYENDIARGTYWGALNAITQYQDHQRHSTGVRLNSRLFGVSAKAKRGALEVVRIAAGV